MMHWLKTKNEEAERPSDTELIQDGRFESHFGSQPALNKIIGIIANVRSEICTETKGKA